MEIMIKPILASDFAHLRKKMKREHLTDGTLNTHYIGAYAEGNLVGVVGWMVLGKVIRYKTDYVVQEYRGKGIYSLLFQEREKIFKKHSHVCTAFCTQMSIHTYTKNGFCIEHERNGIAFVKRISQ